MTLHKADFEEEKEKGHKSIALLISEADQTWLLDFQVVYQRASSFQLYHYSCALNISQVIADRPPNRSSAIDPRGNGIPPIENIRSLMCL